MYGERFIKKELELNSFQIIKKHRFHVASILASKIGFGDSIDYKFIHMDFLLLPFSYFLAHNIILKCKKSVNRKTQSIRLWYYQIPSVCFFMKKGRDCRCAISMCFGESGVDEALTFREKTKGSCHFGKQISLDVLGKNMI